MKPARTTSTVLLSHRSPDPRSAAKATAASAEADVSVGHAHCSVQCTMEGLAVDCRSDVYLVVQRLADGQSIRALLLGSPATVAEVLTTIHRCCRERVYHAWWRAQLSPSEHGTAIIHDVATLTPDQQQELLEWVGTRGHDWSIVATSTTPLFPFVLRGLFSQDLFYRLNLITIDCLASADELLHTTRTKVHQKA